MMKRMASGSCGGIAESGISLSSRNGWRQGIFRGFGITGTVADCGRRLSPPSRAESGTDRRAPVPPGRQWCACLRWVFDVLVYDIVRFIAL